MPNTHSTLTGLFTDIANAIRSKAGTSGAIVADAFPAAIEAIPSGGHGIEGIATQFYQYGEFTVPSDTTYYTINGISWDTIKNCLFLCWIDDNDRSSSLVSGAYASTLIQSFFRKGTSPTSDFVNRTVVTSGYGAGVTGFYLDGGTSSITIELQTISSYQVNFKAGVRYKWIAFQQTTEQT